MALVSDKNVFVISMMKEGHPPESVIAFGKDADSVYETASSQHPGHHILSVASAFDIKNTLFVLNDYATGKVPPAVCEEGYEPNPEGIYAPTLT